MKTTEILIVIPIFLMFLLFIFALYMSFRFSDRNHAIYFLRLILLKRVSEKAMEDIKNGRDWEWRYKYMESVTYEKMLYQFWKPLKLKYWYPDKSFVLSQNESKKKSLRKKAK